MFLYFYIVQKNKTIIHEGIVDTWRKCRLGKIRWTY